MSSRDPSAQTRSSLWNGRAFPRKCSNNRECSYAQLKVCSAKTRPYYHFICALRRKRDSRRANYSRESSSGIRYFIPASSHVLSSRLCPPRVRHTRCVIQSLSLFPSHASRRRVRQWKRPEESRNIALRLVIPRSFSKRVIRYIKGAACVASSVSQRARRVHKYYKYYK